jgi:enoyl reductase-like protein
MAREDNKNAVTHGIHSFERNGPAVLKPFEVQSLDELRELASTEGGRTAIKEEIIARLMIVCRKFFSDLANNPGPEGRFWDRGVIARGGTYLSELRRWVDSMPQDKQQPIDVGAITAKYRGEDAPNS